MTLQEVFKELDLKGSHEEQCKQYSEMLDSGYVLGVFPEELTGNDTSPDGIWSWPKITGFINKYKNNVDLHEVTCIFENPLPEGVFIIKSYYDESSMLGERDRILARITKNKFVDVRVNYEFNKIYWAKEVSRNFVDKEISQLIIHSADWYFKPFLDMYKAEDSKNVLGKTSYNIITWLRFYRDYLDGIHDNDREELFIIWLNYYLGLSYNEAEWFIDKWNEDWQEEDDYKKMKAEKEKYNE